MRHARSRLIVAAVLWLLAAGCTRPEVPDTEQPPEPQASEPAEAVGD